MDAMQEVIVKVPRKGDLSYYKSWRGIILLSVTSKVFGRDYRSNVRAVLLYGVESRRMTEADISRLRGFDNKFLRRIVISFSQMLFPIGT